MADRYVLRIARAAEDDLAAIYEYGFRQWGEQQADRYFDALLAHLDQLCHAPFLYPAVDDVRAGYRRSVCGAHSVYYRVSGDAVEVMALIGRQDIDHIVKRDE